MARFRVGDIIKAKGSGNIYFIYKETDRGFIRKPLKLINKDANVGDTPGSLETLEHNYIRIGNSLRNHKISAFYT